MLEQQAIEQGSSAYSLMQCAGEAALQSLKQQWPEAQDIFVLCGCGNNGGDGYVLARLAQQQGYRVQLRYLGDLTHMRRPADIAYQAYLQAQGVVKEFNADEVILADVLVDALLGAGLVGMIKEEYVQAITWLNRQVAPVLAIDVPSGIDINTGQVAQVATVADVTITFIGKKVGMHMAAAVDYCGQIICHDLYLPSTVLQKISPIAHAINFCQFAHALTQRPKSAHKGNTGHVLVVGGGKGMAGAASMAAHAAYRVGAGLVTIATCPENVTTIAAGLSEAMVQAVVTAEDMDKLIQHANVIVLGPGLGLSEWSRLCYRLVMTTNKVKVIDADGLNLLAQQQTELTNAIITPHPGEAGRLLACSSQDIQSDRIQNVRKLANRYRAVVVLKGAGSLVCQTDLQLKICLAGNSGMATGGMGDVLSGMIAGIVAQGVALEQAAQLAVLLHATAADRLADKQGRIGMMASDLLPEIRRQINLHV